VGLGALVAYLIGAIPVGLLVARAFGRGDVRRHGSGNIGATNVLRTAGRVAALVTLVGDVAKGYLAVLVGGIPVGGDPVGLAVCGVAAVAGNCWPVYLGFRGGKGVATGLGVFLRVMPLATLGAAAVWLAVVAASRYVSLASVVAAASAPVWAAFLADSRATLAAAGIVALIVVLRHRDNLRRLARGTEPRLGQRVSA
jgi:glycerol-3-phosphate acyltransferase PlsY